MVRRLEAAAPGFEQAFAEFLALGRTQGVDVARERFETVFDRALLGDVSVA